MTDHLLPGTGRGRALYDRRRDERDACGIGFVADVHGRPGRAVLDAALCGLERLRHRGAVAADARTGDGAGVLVPLPDAFFAGPAAGHQGDRPGVAMAFLPRDPSDAKEARRVVEQALVAEGLELLRWRLVPVDLAALGDLARATAPAIEQAVFRVTGADDPEEAERRCFRAGRRAALAATQAEVGLYLASCSTRTVTYKALCAADQLAAFYPDLADPAFAVAFAVFHQRYSTNTAPSWERAQPFRFLCHNGEINTLDGNVAWMRAREGHLGAGELDEQLLRPVLDP
ncbi:MAG TPA: glutamate synthase subunit alpha, partial [Actinomycetota bacterium]